MSECKTELTSRQSKSLSETAKLQSKQLQFKPSAYLYTKAFNGPQMSPAQVIVANSKQNFQNVLVKSLGSFSRIFQVLVLMAALISMHSTFATLPQTLAYQVSIDMLAKSEKLELYSAPLPTRQSSATAQLATIDTTSHRSLQKRATKTIELNNRSPELSKALIQVPSDRLRSQLRQNSNIEPDPDPGPGPGPDIGSASRKPKLELVSDRNEAKVSYGGKSMARAPLIETNDNSPELTYRHAFHQSNNGSSTTQSPLQSSESQWIPIVGQQRPQLANQKAQPTSYSPRLSNNRQNPMNRHLANAPRPTELRPGRPPQRPRRPAVGVGENRGDRQRHTNRVPVTLAVSSSRHRDHFYRPPISHYEPQWQRRPRFNEDFEVRANKMYKRVLLCDKTLVSLDYVKNLELEPRPFGIQESSHYSLEGEDFFDDNFVDLDSNNVEISELYLDRRTQNNSTTGAFTPSSTISPLTFELDKDELVADTNIDRRSHLLTDEDPLVKCDMWDLERGIKNRKPPESILRMAVKADFNTVRDAINRCRQLSERTLPAEDEFRDQGIELMSSEDLMSLFSMKRGLIPGTKWCGLGDQASSYNDLGPKHRIDICCRAHDHCPIRLKPFRNDYGVLNIALYTKSHCDCDADFYRCLRDLRSRTADMLGNLYFNVMKLQCMREERVKICREMRPIALGFERCVRYEESPVKTVFKFTTPPVAY